MEAIKEIKSDDMEALDKQDFLDAYIMIIPGIWENRTSKERYSVTFDYNKALIGEKYIGEIK